MTATYWARSQLAATGTGVFRCTRETTASIWRFNNAGTIVATSCGPVWPNGDALRPAWVPEAEVCEAVYKPRAGDQPVLSIRPAPSGRSAVMRGCFHKGPTATKTAGDIVRHAAADNNRRTFRPPP